MFIGSDKVYVTDVRTHHVLIFSLNGDLIKRFGGKGNTPHKLNYPSGVFVCHEGSDEHIYVCTTEFLSSIRVVSVADGWPISS